LLNTGNDAGTINAQRLSFIATKDLTNFDKLQKSLSLAGIVKGRFKSVFKKKPEESQYSAPHVDEASGENSVLLIADVDFLNNNYSLRKLNFLGQTMLQPLNQNITFLTNSLEFISGSSELISIRSRGSFNRPFDRVEEIERKAQAKWFSVEKGLTETIQGLQKNLNELQQAKTQDNQLMLSQVQQDKIKNFKLELLKIKRQRREVRKNLRQDIERLGTMLTVINMTVVPIIILLIGLYIYIKRSQGSTISRGVK
jgi:ABC-type uncharacterized transport system involved in gliding motility auxiliary subunit